jgi:hypothetical protein
MDLHEKNFLIASGKLFFDVSEVVKKNKNVRK